MDDIRITIDKPEDIRLKIEKAGGGGSYPPLTNKPQINGVTLLGNKTSEDIKVQGAMDEITPQDIDSLIYG